MPNVPISDCHSDSGHRIKGLTVVKPIVYGSIAHPYDQKPDENNYYSHRWQVYVKPYDNEDMSAYVKKVQFKLHDSYANPLRILTQPPYEVSESGWGEFEIIIKLYFHDASERMVTLKHQLLLFCERPLPMMEINRAVVPVVNSSKKEGVLSEWYDELVFKEPTPSTQRKLNAVQPLTQEDYLHDTDFPDLIARNASHIADVAARVKAEIAMLRDKLNLAHTTIVRFREALSKAQTSAIRNDGTP